MSVKSFVPRVKNYLTRGKPIRKVDGVGDWRPGAVTIEYREGKEERDESKDSSQQ